MYELYYLDLATGLRRGELLGLKWEDVNLEQGIIHVRRQVARINGEVKEVPLKTKNSYRSIAISKDTVDNAEKAKSPRSQRVCLPLTHGRPHLARQRSACWATSPRALR